jgi:hypothetical protein
VWLKGKADGDGRAGKDDDRKGELDAGITIEICGEEGKSNGSRSLQKDKQLTCRVGVTAAIDATSRDRE